ncbi:hypothetical protein [Mesobacillus foraminis]|uniref:Uncharacterized protein n=1 Tax=Mesobacillus foraminis TaxID=279826 RepID=A0A4R2BLL7_9BACI|nr:hypothetical protein [Mesobacillus foraminis]TCN27966.1 hypothetical protein EV146_101296 [Mesobacillus foraminis]
MTPLQVDQAEISPLRSRKKALIRSMKTRTSATKQEKGLHEVDEDQTHRNEAGKRSS